MKILISSSVLRKSLNHFYSENEYVKSIVMHDNKLGVIGDKFRTDVDCHILEFKPHVLPQIDARWDWVHSLMNGVSEQPIVMQFQENAVQVIFQY